MKKKPADKPAAPLQRPYAAQGSSPQPQPAKPAKVPVKAPGGDAGGDWDLRHDKLSRGN